MDKENSFYKKQKPRKCFYYKDKEVKRFNHVTVVNGETSLKPTFRADLDNLSSKIDEIIWYMTDIFETTGRSKCSSEDKYDEKTGLIVASRKAELKGTKQLLNKMSELKETAEKFLELTKEAEDVLDYKVNKLELDLIAFNRKGE